VLFPSVALRLEVENIDPCIWRVVRVPNDLRLSELHQVVQMVLGWTNRGAHNFELQDRTPLTACRRETQCGARGAVLKECCTISEALASARGSFMYLYDVAGKWRVRISRAPGTWRGKTTSPIACLDGYLAGPRDDGDGPEAYSVVLAATLGRGPRLTRAQVAWLGPDFDPERFDRTGINRALAVLARNAS
jgi:hypothetical protein